MRLRTHASPGNVLELRNLLEQAVIFHGDGEIGLGDLPMLGPGQPVASADTFVLPDSGLNLEELERSLTIQALERTGWNMTQAGRLLGLSRDAMRHRADKYGLRADAGGDA